MSPMLVIVLTFLKLDLLQFLDISFFKPVLTVLLVKLLKLKLRFARSSYDTGSINIGVVRHLYFNKQLYLDHEWFKNW